MSSATVRYLRIVFSNWSRGSLFRMSTLSGACVLCALAGA
jgi:hypothetical protein